MHRLDAQGDQRKKLDACTPPQTLAQFPRAQTLYMYKDVDDVLL